MPAWGGLDEEQQRNYINFYGNLMKPSDKYLVRILEILEAPGLLDNTLVIRTSDHRRWAWRMAASGRRISTSMRSPCVCR
jgi:arylsulfatase A-like enzyme